LYTIDTTILRNRPKSTKKTTPLLPLRLCLRSSSCGGTPGSAFRAGVGRPPFFLRRGYPTERISCGSGAPPSCGDSAGPSRNVRLPLKGRSVACPHPTNQPRKVQAPAYNVVWFKQFRHPRSSSRRRGLSPRSRRRCRRGRTPSTSACDPSPGAVGRDSPRRRSGPRSPPAGGRGRVSTPRSTPSRRPANSPPFWRPSIDFGTRGSTR